MRNKSSQRAYKGTFSHAIAALFAKRSRLQLALLGGLIAIGALAIVVSHGHQLSHHHESVARILEAMGEALLIAGLLAAVADPFVQQRFAEEWGIGVFWAIFNRDAPSSLRQAINTVAQPERYYAHSEWRIELAWEDESQSVLLVDVVNHRRIVCVAKDGWHPVDVSSGIVTDFEGKSSRFTQLEINAKDWSVALDEDSIEEHVQRDRSGTSRLDPKKLLDGHRVGYRDELVFTTGMRTRLRRVDSLPLFSKYTTLDWTVEVRGNAVPDLFFELFGSSFAKAGVKSQSSPPRWTFRSKKHAVTFPGHGLVLQWRPAAEVSSSDGAVAAGL